MSSVAGAVGFAAGVESQGAGVKLQGPVRNS